MPQRSTLVAMLLVFATGCTITQIGHPVAIHAGDPNEVCVIEDPAVDQSFLPAFQSALEARSFAVRVLQPGSPPTSCPLTATYYARWSWDFVTYMSHARVVVYRDGVHAGDAAYDSPKAGWSMTPRIYESTESKVATMVNQIFP
jgi:hypothetical protein